MTSKLTFEEPLGGFYIKKGVDYVGFLEDATGITTTYGGTTDTLDEAKQRLAMVFGHNRVELSQDHYGSDYWRVHVTFRDIKSLKEIFGRKYPDMQKTQVGEISHEPPAGFVLRFHVQPLREGLRKYFGVTGVTE